MRPIIRSVLDTDIYKLYMQQFVYFRHPSKEVEYTFINRDNRKFTRAMVSEIAYQVKDMEELKLSIYEHCYLASLGVFEDQYLRWLDGNRFDASRVNIVLNGSELKITIRGSWLETILWEVPLMAIISEVYNQFSFQTQYPLPISAVVTAYKKCLYLERAGNIFPTEFGTRRRFSFEMQKQFLLQAICVWGKENVSTSNVHLARILDIKCVGTQAHELYVALNAGHYLNPNTHVLEEWAEFYRGKLGIALTDTYTSDVFFKEFDGYYARLYDGLRQDSGDPLAFISKAVTRYRKLGIDYSSKTLIFSDSLCPEKCVEIARRCRDTGIKCAFGVGTNFTNDVDGHDPLNIVIKLTAVFDQDGKRIGTVKLSDNVGKHTGDPADIAECKRQLEIEGKNWRTSRS